MASHNTALSFGCFHLALKREPPYSITGADYIATVRRSLEQLPSLDDLKIDIPSPFPEEDFRAETTVPALDDAYGFFPSTQLGTISFTLHIPDRLQRELLIGPKEGPPLTHTENFLFRIDFGFAMPIAMVHPLEPTDEPEPSEAVQIAREFLERELQRVSSDIELQTLGPSPSHTDVYLQGVDASAEPWLFHNVSYSRPAFHRFLIQYDETLLRTGREAAEEFFDRVVTELDLFYQAAQADAVHLTAWLAVRERVAALNEAQQASGLRARFTKAVRTSRRLTEAFIELSEFETDVISRTSEFEQYYRKAYAPGTTRYLKELVTEKLDDRPAFPTGQVGALLQQFEARRLTDRELIAGMIGAAVGAAAALIAG